MTSQSTKTKIECILPVWLLPNFIVVVLCVADFTVCFFCIHTQPMSTNCGVAIKDCGGDRSKNELQFRVGDLITNISKLCDKW